MQHTRRYRSGRGVADEAETAHLLLGKPEGAHLGALAEEMANHQRFTMATDIKVYFCDPQSPWQRGSNENANGLLRQYLPKGINLSAYSQSKLNAIARRLNERPRKTQNYETPAERFHQSVASTG
jgi:IS30 family transposase